MDVRPLTLLTPLLTLLLIIVMHVQHRSRFTTTMDELRRMWNVRMRQKCRKTKQKDQAWREKREEKQLLKAL